MSDYMFMLDSHLSGEQSKALAEVREAAEQVQFEPVPHRRRHARHDGAVFAFAILTSPLRAPPSNLPKP